MQIIEYDRVQIPIADHGVGISEKVTERIFAHLFIPLIKSRDTAVPCP